MHGSTAERNTSDAEWRRGASIDCETEINSVLVAAEETNTRIRIVVEGVLNAVGFRNHHRGEWRIARGTNAMSTLLTGLQDSVNLHPPFHPSAGLDAGHPLGGAHRLRVDRVLHQRNVRFNPHQFQ